MRVNGGVLARFFVVGDQFFEVADGLGSHKRVRANVTDLRRYALKHTYFIAVLDRVHDRPVFVFAGTSLNTAFERERNPGGGCVHLRCVSDRVPAGDPDQRELGTGPRAWTWS